MQQSNRIMNALSLAMGGVKPVICKKCKAHIYEEPKENDIRMACGCCGEEFILKGERK